MFDQEKNTKEVDHNRIIPWGCHNWTDLWTLFCLIQGKRPVSQGTPGHSMLSNPRSLIFEGYCRRWFERDKAGISNLVFMLSPNNNKRITWHRKGLHAHESDSFQNDRKSQDPENGHLSVNALHGQESKLIRPNLNCRQKEDRVR